jgi:hypothetical protein
MSKNLNRKQAENYGIRQTKAGHSYPSRQKFQKYCFPPTQAQKISQNHL